METPLNTPNPAQGDGGAAASMRPSALSRLSYSQGFVALRSFAVFLALWYAFYAWNANPLQLPSPLRVISALGGLAVSGEVLEHALISTARLSVALLLAMVLAVPLGFFMGLSSTANAFIDPLVELLRPISGIAWIPLGLFIFGVGDTLPVFIMVYVAFFPILLNTIAGVRQVDRKLVAAARTMGINRTAMLRHVLVRAVPHLVIEAFDEARGRSAHSPRPLKFDPPAPPRRSPAARSRSASGVPDRALPGPPHRYGTGFHASSFPD